MKPAEKKREICVVWYPDKNLERRKDRIVWAGSLKSARSVVKKIMKDMPEGWHVRIMREHEVYVQDKTIKWKEKKLE
ncbi:MAG: hypothetical protein KKE50_02055 [Nanoarchaeota archaeon]|nr:hypothetical protein [Nanoarchaeota archaeon]